MTNADTDTDTEATPAPRRTTGRGKAEQPGEASLVPGRGKAEQPGEASLVPGRGKAEQPGEASHVPGRGKAANQINATIRYTMWSVFRAESRLSDEDRATIAEEVDALFAELAGKGVVVRGVYDVAGLRAEADLMIWWHAEEAPALQEAYARFRHTTLGRACVPVWSQLALHRPAEFNKSHVPAFLAEEEPRGFVCVYPFVRSYEWYLLPDEERRAMLAEHGQLARGYPDVRANTVASFGLGDYEWILAFEADELHRIVDLMRDLRASTARRHVREEVPFYTGARKPITELVSGLP